MRDVPGTHWALGVNRALFFHEYSQFPVETSALAWAFLALFL